MPARGVRKHSDALRTLRFGWPNCAMSTRSPVWQWGFIERVSTGRANVREFEGDDGLVFLEVAARCL